MAVLRCMICFVFVALSVKVLLSHINATHSRSPDFWVYCGIDGCEQDFRVFNSFFRHIKRTHPLYLTTACPPTEWTTTPTPCSHSLGSENFGVAVFSNCITHASTSAVEIPPEVSPSATTNAEEMPPEASQPETLQPQVPDRPVSVSVESNLFI